MGDHTKEPWRVFNHSWCETSILADGFDHGICRLDINHATEESQDADSTLMEANARRIVACVNACEGMPTPDLEAGHSAFINISFAAMRRNLELEANAKTLATANADNARELQERISELESALAKSASREAALVAVVAELSVLAKESHYTCEDGWYSCPKSPEGSANDDAGDECNCGADEHNMKVVAALAKIKEA